MGSLCSTASEDQNQEINSQQFILNQNLNDLTPLFMLKHDGYFGKNKYQDQICIVMNNQYTTVSLPMVHLKEHNNWASFCREAFILLTLKQDKYYFENYLEYLYIDPIKCQTGTRKICIEHENPQYKNELLNEGFGTNVKRKDLLKMADLLIVNLSEQLAHLHRLGIVHDDLSPNNILYDWGLKKWFIIDYNSASIVNTNWNDRRGTPGFLCLNGCSDQYVDLYKFTVLIKFFFKPQLHFIDEEYLILALHMQHLGKPHEYAQTFKLVTGLLKDEQKVSAARDFVMKRQKDFDKQQTIFSNMQS